MVIVPFPFPILGGCSIYITGKYLPFLQGSSQWQPEEDCNSMFDASDFSDLPAI